MNKLARQRVNRDEEIANIYLSEEGLGRVFAIGQPHDGLLAGAVIQVVARPEQVNVLFNER